MSDPTDVPVVPATTRYSLVDRGYQIIKNGSIGLKDIKNNKETDITRMVCLLSVIANELIILNNKTPKPV